MCCAQLIMKIEEVKQRLLKIEKLSHDDEVAHCEEDELFYDFVEAIKDGKYKSKHEIINIATELYKVRDIDFARWHA